MFVSDSPPPPYNTFKSWNDMGRIYAQLDLVNHDDVILSDNGYKDKTTIRRQMVEFMVDTGADYLCINEEIQSTLQLKVLDNPVFTMADGSSKQLNVVGPVEFYFQNRRGIAEAVVLPRDATPRLGSIPMEIMDVIAYPKSQTLVVNPESPNIALHFLK